MQLECRSEQYNLIRGGVCWLGGGMMEWKGLVEQIEDYFFHPSIRFFSLQVSSPGRFHLLIWWSVGRDPYRRYEWNRDLDLQE